MSWSELVRFKYWPQLFVVLLLIMGYGCYRYFAYYDTRSSDAYVSAHVTTIAPLVTGPITTVYVKDNQKVAKGDKLFAIEPLPFNYAQAQAQAKLQKVLLSSNEREILAAKAELQQANYWLKHTVVRAPEEGYIANVTIRQGQYVKAGEPLFALIETAQWWIETRYRETAIRLIKPGDKATITIDMYPGKTFHGHVNSIGWGINRVQAGNVASSALIYLEPTEDWIQIAQRFPVRIDIDDVSDEYPLRVGASATTITYR